MGGWKLFSVEGTTTAVTVWVVDTIVTPEEAVPDANVITTSHFKINMAKLMEPAREEMRQAGYGAILLGMDVVMLGSHRGSLATLGHTRHVGVMVGNRIVLMYVSC